MRSNKLFKKIAAVGLAGMMTAAMALPAMAAPTDTSVSVTGITAGDTAAFYQVITADSTTSSGWKLATGFESLNLNDLLDGAISAEDAAAIVTAAKDATAVDTQTSGYSYATDTDAKAGLYLVLITPGSNNKTTLYNPVFVSADYDSTTSNTIDLSNATGTYNNAELKKQTPEVLKEHTDAAQKDVNVGDIVTFKVTTKIPAMSTYTKPVFEVSDAVSTGLEIQTETITLSKPTGLTKGTEYTLAPSTTGYTVAFSETYLKSLTAGVDVEITYSAKVTSTAQYNVNEMTNTASIKFSNNPTDETGNGTDNDKTYHYTFSLDSSIIGQTDKYNEELIKIAVDSEGSAITSYNKTYNGTERAALQGATFALYTDDACTDAVAYKQNGTAVTATSDANGDIFFTGLDAGTYYLKETAVPSGFVLNNQVYTVTISANYDADGKLQDYSVVVSGENGSSTTSSYTISNAGTPQITSSDGDAATNIQNVKANGLPSTGGIGTTIFYAFGSVLVIGAGVVMITRRRMEVQ